MKTQCPKSKCGSAMVATVFFITIFTWVAGSYLTVVSSSSLGTYKIGDQARAFYTAEAGAYRLLHELNNGGSSSYSSSLSTGTYTGNYAATYNSATGVITSTGTVGTLSRTVTVRTLDIPPNVGGAVTVNSSVTTSGSITLDGRDHDEDGDLTGASGVSGIASSGLVTQTGSSKIGGNGKAPASPALLDAVQQNVDPFPSVAPWDVLGVSQAWFEANVPVQTTPPPENFSGIYYYDPPGGIWNSVDLGNASGILIVHNSTNTATMKNIHGIFKGLIITDQVTHVNGDATIIGAFMTTTQVGNVLGNGNASIYYSSETLNGLKSLIGNQTTNWKKTIQDSSWTEES